jgi:hypothetical protein
MKLIVAQRVAIINQRNDGWFSNYALSSWARFRPKDLWRYSIRNAAFSFDRNKIAEITPRNKLWSVVLLVLTTEH